MPHDDVDARLAPSLAWSMTVDREQALRAVDANLWRSDAASVPEPVDPADPRRLGLIDRLRRLFRRRVEPGDVHDLLYDERMLPEVLESLPPELGTRLASLLHGITHSPGTDDTDKAGKLAAHALKLQDSSAPELLLELVRQSRPQFCGPVCERLSGALGKGALPSKVRGALWSALAKPDLGMQGIRLGLLLIESGRVEFDAPSARAVLVLGRWQARGVALQALMKHGALQSTDVERLLIDQIHRTLPEISKLRREDLACAQELERRGWEAVQTVPSDIIRSLLPRVVMQREIDEVMGGRWALAALASLDLAAALPLIDLHLNAFGASRRCAAVAALQKAPDALALPRLERCAHHDPVPRVAVAARDALQARGVRVEPLLASGDREARTALLREVSARVAADAALPGDVVALIALRCDPDLASHTRFADAVAELPRSVGETLEPILLALAERWPWEDGDGPLTALARRCHTAGLTDAGLAKASRLAVARLAHPFPEVVSAAAALLPSLGVLPEDWERVYDHPDLALRRKVMPALELCEPCPALDSRLAADCADPENPLRREVLKLGVVRGVAAVVKQARELVLNAQTEDEVSQAFKLAEVLLGYKRLAPAELLEDLAECSGPRLRLRWDAVPAQAPVPRELRAPLLRALVEGCPEAAGCVGMRLLELRELPLDDPRWATGLHRASDFVLGRFLAHALLDAGVAFELLESALERLLACDPGALSSLRESLQRSPGGRKLVARVERARRMN